MDEDGVYRYRLDGSRRDPMHAARLAEMVREQLCNLLDIAQPLRGEDETLPDSFRFLGPERRVYELHNGNGTAHTAGGEGEAARQEEAQRPGMETASVPGEAGSVDTGRYAACPARIPHAHDLEVDTDKDTPYANLANAALYEPRIEFIARQLASLLSVVELESGGEPVRVDGFRLRDLEDWVGPHAATPADIFNHAATRCQYDCVFCYNRGMQGSLEPGRGDVWEDMEKRLELYDAPSGRGLFPSFGSPREALAHPRILPLLRALREKTTAPFRLCSNGGVLDREFVAALAELAPVYIDLSLNSSSPRRRSLLMGDARPQEAIAAPALLAEASIPFAITVVAWPHPGTGEMLEDLARTARYAEAMQARLVQVNLPGYSRFLSPRPLFDTDEVWSETVRTAQRLRGGLSCPVFVSPSLYEENLTRERKNQAEVIGVVRNSPAARWGLAAGDTVTAVNGIAVKNRPQARDLLSLVQGSGAGRATITARRAGRVVELAGDTGDWDFPFDTATGTHLGAVFMGAGLRESCLEKLEALARESGGGEILLLTSTLIRPTLEQLLRERPLTLPELTALRLGVPRNRYFGGNIMLGDLMVVQDFIDFLREYLAGGNARPDLVVIPSSPFHLSGWKRDLTGRPYQDIAQETGLPVSLLECPPMWE
ncbi:MAG: radical SAM protein [Actinobacteria bacterium]|jgi:pyruvate-formate lyase-activating enzyme|nr:MAG: radical SAM protein [Actinomycetota bacterium]